MELDVIKVHSPFILLNLSSLITLSQWLDAHVKYTFVF